MNEKKDTTDKVIYPYVGGLMRSHRRNLLRKSELGTDIGSTEVYVTQGRGFIMYLWKGDRNGSGISLGDI